MARRALLAFAALCVGLVVAVYVVAFDSARGAGWDSYAIGAATAERNIPRIHAASARLIETIDIGSLVLLGGGLVVVGVFIRRWRAAIGALLVVAGANATTQVLKPSLGAAAPFGDPRAELQSSFPSGHATVAMSLALAAVLVAPPSWKLFVALGGAAYAAAIGISLLIQASHYPSDVAGGYLVTGAWAGAVGALFGLDRSTRSGSARQGLIAAGVMAAGFAVAVAVTVHRHPGIVLRVHLETKLVFIVGVLAALALAVAIGLALLLQAIAWRSASTTRS